MLRLGCLLVLIAIMSACTQNLTLEQKNARLDDTLQKWRAFQMQGVLELHYQAYSLHKDCVISKNAGELRLDLISGGLFGLRASPFYSAYFNADSVQVRLPDGSLQQLPLAEWVESSGLNLTGLFACDFNRAERDSILIGKHLHKEGIDFFFDDDYLLIRAAMDDNAMLIEYLDRLPYRLLFTKQGQELGNLFIDRIIFTTPRVKRLMGASNG